MKEQWQFTVEEGKVSIQRMSVMNPGRVLSSVGPFNIDQGVIALVMTVLGFEPNNARCDQLSAEVSNRFVISRQSYSGWGVNKKTPKISVDRQPMTDQAKAAELVRMLSLIQGYQPPRCLYRHDRPFDQTQPAQRWESETLDDSSQGSKNQQVSPDHELEALR